MKVYTILIVLCIMTYSCNLTYLNHPLTHIYSESTLLFLSNDTINACMCSYWRTRKIHYERGVMDIYNGKAKKINMCVSDFPTDSPFSRRPTQVFLLCDFFIGDHIEKNEVNRTTLREVMRFWRQNFLKWVQILNIWREISLQDNNKIFHPFFSNTDSVFLLCDSIFFIEDHI